MVIAWIMLHHTLILNKMGFFTSIIDFYPRCTEYTQVYDSTADVQEGTNKAWTNRVWSGAEDNPGRLNFMGTGNEDVPRSQPLSPFGSTQFRGNHLNSYPTLRKNYLFDSSRDGIPLACQDGLFVGQPGMSSHVRLFGEAFMCASLSPESVQSGGYGEIGLGNQELREICF